MDTKTVQQYRCELTLPHSTISVTSNDLKQLQGFIRVIGKAENLNVNFDENSSESTIFVLDNNQQPLGTIATYEVPVTMSVSHLVQTRKQAQKAA